MNSRASAIANLFRCSGEWRRVAIESVSDGTVTLRDESYLMEYPLVPCDGLSLVAILDVDDEEEQVVLADDVLVLSSGSTAIAIRVSPEAEERIVLAEEVNAKFFVLASPGMLVEPPRRHWLIDMPTEEELEQRRGRRRSR